MPTTRVLIDWKTGTFPAPEQRLQLGAYFGCPMAYDKADAISHIQIPPDAGAVIHVGADGVWLLTALPQKADLETAYQAFLAGKSVMEYLQRFDAKPPVPQRYVIGGTKYVSTTQILGYVIAKEGLMKWYWQQGKDGKNPWEERDKKAVSGSTLHKIIHAYLTGTPVDVSANDDLDMFMQKFSRWCQLVKLKPEDLEQTVYHPEYGYAGTLDALVSVDTEAWQGWLEKEQARIAKQQAEWKAKQQREDGAYVTTG